MALLCAIGLFVLAVNGDSIGDDADRFTLALTLQSSNDVDIGEDAFNQMFRDSPEHILKRECSSCGSTHRVIYYKRYTDLTSFNLYRYTFDWESTNNVLGDDFNLFSTLEDALADTNPWKYCNYDDDQIGMFRDCGPTGYVAHEWTSRTRGGDAASFYIYTPPPTINCDVWDNYPAPSAAWMIECCGGKRTAKCGYDGRGGFIFAHNDPMADKFVDEQPEFEPVSGNPEDAVWAIQVSGKELVIMALFAINMVTLTVLCCSCWRFGGASARRKYGRVEVVGDSETEQFQP